MDELAQRLEAIMRQGDGTSEEIEQLVLLQLPQILDSFRATVVAEFQTAEDAEQAKAFGIIDEVFDTRPEPGEDAGTGAGDVTPA